jgi:hypothetical protein
LAPDSFELYFNPSTPDAGWVKVSTYIRTSKRLLSMTLGGDLLSRKIIGWSM